MVGKIRNSLALPLQRGLEAVRHDVEVGKGRVGRHQLRPRLLACGVIPRLLRIAEHSMDKNDDVWLTLFADELCARTASRALGLRPSAGHYSKQRTRETGRRNGKHSRM